MEKKSVSATLLIIFLSAVFAVVGSCFYFFVYKEKQIKVENVKIVAESGILVFEDEEKTKVSTSLKLSDMEIGLKPATGKIDQETEIPSTITDEGTSEGYYASVYVDSISKFSVTVKNIQIETKKSEEDVKKERENIFVAILDKNESTKNLQEDSVKIATFDGSANTQKLTFLIWLGALADDILQGSKISFDISFEKVNN